MYVLLTSLDPLTVYIYEDGLVRIATEKYSEHPRSVNNTCIHVTNFDVNRKNGEKYVWNECPDEAVGNKVRRCHRYAIFQT